MVTRFLTERLLLVNLALCDLAAGRLRRLDSGEALDGGMVSRLVAQIEAERPFARGGTCVLSSVMAITDASQAVPSQDLARGSRRRG